MVQFRFAEPCIRLPGNDTSTVMEMTEMLRDLIKQDADHTIGSIKYKRSFYGHQVTKVSQSVFCTSFGEARLLAKHLLECGILVALQEGDFGVDGLYRLQCNQTPHILNSYRLLRGPSSDGEAGGRVDYVCYMHELLDMLQRIEANAMDDEGTVDVSMAGKQPQFRFFEQAICVLHSVDMGVMDDATKIAFGLNVYNLMVKYAVMKYGAIPSNNATAHSAFFSSLRFIVGNHEYSFNDWEHGILRGNAKPPGCLSTVLSRSDPRYQYIVKNPDPRIQFGLNRATRHCPPIVRYSAKNLEAELAIAAANYCDDKVNVRLEKEVNELQLAHVFRAYRSDFVASERDLPQVIAGYVKGTEKRERLERAIRGNVKNAIAISYRLPDYVGTGTVYGATFDTRDENVTGRGVLFRGSSRLSPGRQTNLVRSKSSTV